MTITRMNEWGDSTKGQVSTSLKHYVTIMVPARPAWGPEGAGTTMVTFGTVLALVQTDPSRAEPSPIMLNSCAASLIKSKCSLLPLKHHSPPISFLYVVI